MGKLIYPDLSYLLNGIFFKIHNQLGRFRNEKEYGDALENELNKATIKYEREKYYHHLLKEKKMVETK